MAGQNITGDILIEGTGGAFGSVILSTTTEDVELVPDPATASSIVLTLPPNVGTEEEALTTDGAGILTWDTIPNTGNFKCWVCSIPLPASTSAGSFTSGAWRTRSITNMVSYPPGDTDVQLGVSPAATGQLLIQPGVYILDGAATAANVDGHSSRLASGSTPLFVGTSAYSDQAGTASTMNGFLTFNIQTVAVVQQRSTANGNFAEFVTWSPYSPLFFCLIKLA